MYKAHSCYLPAGKDFGKLPLGQKLFLTAPHSVEALLRRAPKRWMSNYQIIQYEVLLLDQPLHLVPQDIRPQSCQLPVEQ